MKKLSKLLIILLLLPTVLLVCCNKKENSLYGISISPNTMVGTPAEMFSLQQIKMFQAANNLTFILIEALSKDSTVNNFAIAPMYMINNLLTDTTTDKWTKAYSEYYGMSVLSHSAALNAVNSFLKTVHDIDSSLNIESKAEFADMKIVNIVQRLHIKLMYPDSAPNDIDNIFTTIDNKKPRLDFMTVSDNIRALITDREQVTELVLGNGNYMLMLIRPLNQSIREYASDFTEEKYLQFINGMQERKINVSLPLFSLTDTVYNLPLPSYNGEDTVINFPVALNIIPELTVRAATAAELSDKTATEINNNILQTNSSAPIKYNSPFLFIIRGKNSNLIMFAGLYAMP